MSQIQELDLYVVSQVLWSIVMQLVALLKIIILRVLFRFDLQRFMHDTCVLIFLDFFFYYGSFFYYYRKLAINQLFLKIGTLDL